jgi:ABC-type branched-subunit amino acid transport system substrate-binding protein
MNKKAVWAVIVIVVIIFIIWGVSGKKSTPVTTEGKAIKIGIVVPLTGPGATFGTSFTKAVELAMQDLKNTKNTYEIITEDDGTNPAQSASAAQKLINVDKVDAIASITSGTGNAIKPIATAAKIPHICVCSDATVANAEYNFTNLILPDDEGGDWLAEAQKKGVKTIAIMHQNQSGINAIVNSIKKLAPQYGISVVYEDKWEPSIRDFKTTIGKARAAKPDMFYLVAFPPSIDIIGKEFSTLGIKNISSSAGFGISAEPSLFEGMWYNDGNLEDISFRTRFEQANPTIRFNVRAAPYGYDTYTMLVNGFESGDIVGYLTNLTSLSGKAGTVTKAVGERSFHSKSGFWIVTNGKAEPYVR